MKKKRFLATCLSTFMTISSVVTPFLSIPVSAAGNLNSFTENGTSDIPISCEVSSGYTVSLPASIALNNDTSKSGYNVGQIYKVGVSGNIASDNFVIVTPKDIDNFALQDVTGSRIVNPVINQTDVSWSSDELGTGSEIVEKDGDIYAQIDLAGSYSGEANFEFYLSDKDVDGVGSKEESRLQLSFENLENSVKSNGDTIMLGTGEDLNIGVSATLDGKDVSTDAITYTTTNNNIYIDNSGDLVVTKNAKPGESATITATVDESTVSTAKADPITFALTKTGIMDSVFAANNVSVSFNVTLVDINFDRIQLVDVDTIAMHPNDRITLKANITPSSALSDLKWHKTDYTVGLNINKVTKDATIITRDMEFGDTFTIIASVGDFAKTLNVVIDHMYTDEDGFIEITDATCTTDGSIVHICRKCGEEKVDVIPALGHKPVSANNAISATCTTAGKESDTKCSVCGITLTTGQSIPVTGHTYGEYTVTKVATCTEDGSKERTCSVCNHVDTAVVTKLGHDYASTFTVDKVATCTEDGSKSKHCNKCDSKSEITSIPATGHTYGSAIYNWSDDKLTCTASRTCSTCSHVDTETVNTTNKVTTAATCTEAGVRTYTATFTNSAFKAQSTTVAVSATGHNYENGKCTICKEADPNFALKAGLYDANDNLLCTWEESGIDIEKDYSADSDASTYYKTSTTSPYYVITNRYPATTKIVIPNGVTNIRTGTFLYCSSLTSIIIPNSVTSIEDKAFRFCTGLISITIPDSVTSIEGGAFSYCLNLTDINVDTNNTVYCAVDGVIFTKDMKELVTCSAGKTGSYVIPDSVTSIGQYAFTDCTGLTSITIPDSVTSIEDCAFSYCRSITNITIGNNVTSIGNFAFFYCTKLTNIIIPNSVTSIGESAFGYCSDLTSITIGNNVTSIGWGAFSYCRSLTGIIIPNSVTNIGSCAFSDCSKLTSATFKTTSGWYAKDSYVGTKSPLNSSDLANTSTAATYLTSTYRNKNWIKE